MTPASSRYATSNRFAAGRGRKGYDDHGTVVVQAPAHVVENKKLEAKAFKDPSRKRKIVKKKPPEHGYVHWGRDTFNTLVKGKPEELKSRFRVSPAMLLNVLSRERGGCSAMKQLLRDCHDRPAVQHRHAKKAIALFGSLARANIIELESVPGRAGKRAVVNVDLQQEFSLNHTLSLYVVETLRVIDKEIESYALEVLSLVEAILEDPTIMLRKQLDRIKGEAVARMKAEGMEYDERMEELEKLEYPKPNAAFIYGTFDEFVSQNPLIASDKIRPKGVARELYESGADLRSYVIDYKLERAEGVVLRYFTDVYKALVQNVPSWARTPEVEDMIDFFDGVVRGVDASLIDEWEHLRDPDYVPPTPAETEEVVAEQDTGGITKDTRAFTVMVRNAAFRVVKALAERRFEAAAAEVVAEDDVPWTAERFESTIAPFYEDHEAIRTDPRARGTENTIIDKEDDRWRVRQKLVDPDEHNDWMLDFEIDLAASDEALRPVMRLKSLGS